MNTKQIEYILELSKTQNFNKAAENLFISQPTLTYQLKLIENEIGFRVFDRSGKGASLTPAGSQFCINLRAINEQWKKAIEQGQNFSVKYQDDISICLPTRSALYFLPETIKEINTLYPTTSVTPGFSMTRGIDLFLQGNFDVLFSYGNVMKKVTDIKTHHLFDSHIYLISKKDDELAEKKIIKKNDLLTRTLMIGGGSPPALKHLQQQIISELNINYFNSPDHDTTLINVASDQGICLAPGFLNDHTDEFAWTPFDTNITIPCKLYTHTNDDRDTLSYFIQYLKNQYTKEKNLKF